MKLPNIFFKPTSFLLSAALTLIASVFIVNAQTSSVDLSFNTVPARSMAGGSLGNFELQPDGKILTFGFGGTKIFNGVPKNQIARLNTDGSLDNSFDCAACDFNINAARVQTDGKIIIAGATNNGVTNAKVRRLNADGSLDGSFVSPFAEGSSTSSYSFANSIIIQPDGKVLVLVAASQLGYQFQSIYRLNTNGTFDASFTTISFGGGRTSSQYVTQIRLSAEGKILAAGGNNGFQSFGFIYRFNADGTRDTTFESPSLGNTTGTASTYVNDFDVQADGSIVFVGRFDSVNSVSRVGLAKLLTAGNVDLAFSQTNFFAPGTTATGIRILANGKLLVAAANLMRFNADGSLDTTFSAPNNFTLASKPVVDAQGRILINVSVVENGATVFRTLRLNPNGSLESTLNIVSATVGVVSVLAHQPDGRVIIGGEFSLVNNVSRNNLARVNTDGSLDTTFNPGSGFDVAPTKIVIQPDGKLLIGGSFTVYNGTARTGIVRLNADGSLDGAFAPIVSSGSVVETIALRDDGKILIGGSFVSVNGQTRRAIALLNADGSLDSAFNPTFGTGSIRSIVSEFDGRVLVGGSFSGVNGFNRTNLVRLNADGTLDTTFNAGNISSVNQIGGQPGGKYIVLTGSLVRLNIDGTTDATFQTPVISSTQNVALNTFMVQSDSSIIIGGNFSAVNNSPRSNIARLQANGRVDEFFLSSGTNGTVNALARTDDGKVLVGGNFSIINGVTRIAVARLTVSPIINVTIAKPFDFDGDGRADVSVFRPSNGTWYTSRNAANNYGAIQFGIASDKLVPADYDGDGKTDVAVFRDGIWYLQRSVLGFAGIQFGLASDIPVPADYDGDGRADLAVFRPSSGTWYLQRSTAGFTTVIFGTGTDKPVPADYNGDGNAEAAVFRPSTGTWYLSQNTGVPLALQFGTSEDKPVPADYDGDGKTDVAVFRPSSRTWYLNRSTAGLSAMTFGLSADLPTAADYDGDGKADIAVFRQGNWYIQATTGGFTSVSFGTTNDQPIPNAYVR